MQINQKKWFKQKEKTLNSTGKLDLSCEALDGLSFIGSRSSLKVLDLSFSSILSFEGLAVQPKIEHLILDGSTISSFKNSSSIANITKISLQNTPVSKIPNYKISLLLICNKNLRIINGKIVPESLKKKAKSYPPIAAKLVDQGWIATYPCPDEAEILTICCEFGIPFDQLPSTLKTNKSSPFKSNDIGGVIAEYSARHEEMIQRSQIMKKPNHYCSMSVTDSNRNYLLNGFQDNETFMNQKYDFDQLPFLVSGIIKKYGFSVDEGNPVDTITSSLINIFSIAEGNEIINQNDTSNSKKDSSSFMDNLNLYLSTHKIDSPDDIFRMNDNITKANLAKNNSFDQIGNNEQNNQNKASSSVVGSNENIQQQILNLKK